MGIDETEYNRMSALLACLWYRHTFISGSILLEAAKLSGWETMGNYSCVTDYFSKEYISVDSTIDIIVDFQQKLYDQELTKEKREKLIISLFKAFFVGKQFNNNQITSLAANYIFQISGLDHLITNRREELVKCILETLVSTREKDAIVDALNIKLTTRQVSNHNIRAMRIILEEIVPIIEKWMKD